MFPSRRITTMGGDKFRDEFSLTFDGTDDYIATSLVPNYTNITMTAWIYCVADADTKAIVAAREAADDGILWYMSTDEDLYIKINGQNVSTTNISVNKWHHTAFTWDGSTAKLYVDGNLESSGSISGTMAITTKMEISRDTTANHYFWNGKMSEITVYNTTLTDSQVRTLYNGREPYNHKEGIASGSLKAWWRMGDGTFDQKGTEDAQGGIVTDMVTPPLGNDDLGGRGNFTDNSDD